MKLLFDFIVLALSKKIYVTNSNKTENNNPVPNLVHPKKKNMIGITRYSTLLL